jgi:hypothetical protein
MNGWRLRTILSVGFSATPWNLLNPVTWTVTGEGPSEPIYLVVQLEQQWNLALPAEENLGRGLKVLRDEYRR